MHESTLRDYFLGRASAIELKNDLEGTAVGTPHDVSSFRVVPMDSEFNVSAEHLVSLCDAVLAERLDANDLEILGFCLEASDNFMWEGSELDDRIAETIHDWASPEINYPLTTETVKKFRERLLTGENLFSPNDLSK
jgi:hypothetical protein